MKLPWRFHIGILADVFKRSADYLQFRPYQPIGVPKLVAQKKRDELAFVSGGATHIALRSRNAYSRSRLLYAFSLVLIVGLGLLWRSHLVPMPASVAKYGGDVLWAIMVFVGFGFLWPQARTWVLALSALTFSFSIEFSQLYHAPWIDHLRSLRLGALILGSTFNWPDLAAYTLGIVAGSIGEHLFQRATTRP